MKRVLAFILMFASAESALGYGIPTHQKMAGLAVTASTLSVPTTLQNLGLLPLAPDSSQQLFPTSQGISQTISGLVIFGVAYEDGRSPLQALRHFYNPVNGQPLTVLPLVTPDITERSPDWEIEDNAEYDQQFYSYEDAQQYFFDALTTPDHQTRSMKWGLMFQSLGHVIHHLQDMSQPQHVRNDAHCESRAFCGTPALLTQTPALYHPSQYEKWVAENPPPDSWFLGYAPVYSVAGTYSPFTKPRKFWTTTDPNGSGVTGTTGQGIAEFTNRGFFSATTTPQAPFQPAPGFPSPTTWGVTFKTPAQACADIPTDRPQCTAAFAADNTNQIKFYASSVYDSLTKSTVDNYAAVSESIFDEELNAKGQSLIFAMNRFNFDAAMTFLLPRAVGYSAGMINFFFRGQMQISLPDEGVYSVADYSSAASNLGPTYDSATKEWVNYSGFSTVKLKVQNITPQINSDGSASILQMQEGLKDGMVAVVKFNRNTCYVPNLSGEYGVVPPSPPLIYAWQSCRRSDDEVVVSDPITVPTGINGKTPVQVSFHFLNPIPFSASDVILQVIYRGPLGPDEDSAVVVATKDISEPTYFSFYNVKDNANCLEFNPNNTCRAIHWADYCQSWGFTDLDQCNTAFRESYFIRFSNSPKAFDPFNPVTSFAPTITLQNVKVGQYARLAILSEANADITYQYLEQNWLLTDPTNPTSYFIFGQGGWTSYINGVVQCCGGGLTNPYIQTISPTVQQLNIAVDPPILNSLTYAPARGIYAPVHPDWFIDDYTALTTGIDAATAPAMNPLGGNPVPGFDDCFNNQCQ